MATRNIVPRSDGEGSIGRSEKRWGKGWFDEGEFSLNKCDDIITKGPWVDVRAYVIEPETFKATLQRAINDNPRGTLVLPPGTITIDGSVIIPDGYSVCIYGQGQFNTIIKFTGSGVLFDGSSDGQLNGCVFKDFSIVGTGESVTGKYPWDAVRDISLQQTAFKLRQFTNGSKIENVRITNVDIGIELQEQWYSGFSNINMYNIRMYGLYINGTDGSQINAVIFDRINIRGGINCVNAQSSTDVFSTTLAFYGCCFEESYETGVVIQNRGAVLFSSCHWERCYRSKANNVLTWSQPINIKLLGCNWSYSTTKIDSCFIENVCSTATDSSTTCSIYTDDSLTAYRHHALSCENCSVKNSTEKTENIACLVYSLGNVYKIEQIIQYPTSIPLIKGSETLGGLLKANSLNNGSIYHYRDLAALYNVGVKQGTIKITLPVSWSNTILKIVIDGFNFTSKTNWKAELSGFNAPSSWGKTSAILSPNCQFSTVRFGHDGTKCCILLGITSTSWDYPLITISDVFAAYTGQNNLIKEWQLEIITDESGINVSDNTNLNVLSVIKGRATSVPASGTYALGDIIHNSAPVAGSFIGWVCTAAGAPGTWKGFGLIQS